MLKFHAGSHTYINDGVILPSVTQILMDMGFINARFFTEDSRNRGTAVHLYVRDHCYGACVELADEWRGYFEAYKLFETECDWKPYAVEEPLCCNLYAGTPDQLGKLNGSDSVLDVKSGEAGPAAGLQLQGYKDLHFWGSPDKEQFMKRFVLQLTKEGKYKLTEYKDRSDQYIWRSSVAIFWWKRNHGI